MNEGAAVLLGILASSAIPAIIIFFLAEESVRLRTSLNLAAAGLKIVLVGVLIYGVSQGQSFEGKGSASRSCVGAPGFLGWPT